MAKAAKNLSKQVNGFQVFHKSQKSNKVFSTNGLKQKTPKPQFATLNKENIIPQTLEESNSHKIDTTNVIESRNEYHSTLISKTIPTYYLPNVLESMNSGNEKSPESLRYLKHFHFMRKCFEVMKTLPVEDNLSCFRSKSSSRKLLVLDLDETLIHTFEEDIPEGCTELTIQIFDQIERKIHFKLRPNCIEFLNRMSNVFDICIFTASHCTYANPIIDYLDPEGTLFKSRYFYDSCKRISKYTVKDLRILNRDLKDVMLVDNTALCFGYQKENGIPIVCYTGQDNDQELTYLIDFLLYLNDFQDVREGIMKHFKWDEFAKLYRDAHALRKYYF